LACEEERGGFVSLHVIVCRLRMKRAAARNAQSAMMYWTVGHEIGPA
jgi:hypothetical protein